MDTKTRAKLIIQALIDNGLYIRDDRGNANDDLAVDTIAAVLLRTDPPPPPPPPAR